MSDLSDAIFACFAFGILAEKLHLILASNIDYMSFLVQKQGFEDSKYAFIEQFHGIQYSKWNPTTKFEVKNAKEGPFSIENLPSVLYATFYPVKATF
ncbi:MAG: hypothetical protein O7E52_03640 [Candidatus Poribacteria bacterium]|nr:hypothetical protein [Candidatus Poribacteria bacterium]